MTTLTSTSDPCVSRTETLEYRFPPSGPLLPPADQCTHADLLDTAAGAASSLEQLRALCTSPDHVRAICRALVVSEELRTAGLQEVERLRAMAIRLSRENAEHLRGAFDRACRGIAGVGYDDLATRLRAERVVVVLSDPAKMFDVSDARSAR